MPLFNSHHGPSLFSQRKKRHIDDDDDATDSLVVKPSGSWFIYRKALENALEKSTELQFPGVAYEAGSNWLHSRASFEFRDPVMTTTTTDLAASVYCICGKVSNQKHDLKHCSICDDWFHVKCTKRKFLEPISPNSDRCVLCQPHAYGFFPFEGISLTFDRSNELDDIPVTFSGSIDCKLCYSPGQATFKCVNRYGLKQALAETLLQAHQHPHLMDLLRRLLCDGNALCLPRIRINDQGLMCLDIAVYLRAENFCFSYDPFTQVIRENTRRWMNLIYPLARKESDSRMDYRPMPFTSLHEFYEFIKADKVLEEVPESPKGLCAILLPFQRRALSWMMTRERETLPMQDIIHLLWKPISLNTGHTIYYNPWNGMIVSIPLQEFLDIRGGILAEEMGLGKTVELISLILKNPMDLMNHVNDHDTHQNLLRSKATLILCPSLIIAQWKDEIETHAPQLSVFIYEGVQRFQGNVSHLADHDIVLTTYEILRQEVYFAKDYSTVSLRAAKKYTNPKSPLVQIQWWRVCIDEAQMVETPTSKLAEMVSRIKACHLWAVTGTPLGKNGFEDLYGLILFLRMYPFNKRIWWKWLATYVYHERPDIFYGFLRQFMWRNTKSHVEQELSLPDQRDETTLLNFSAVERHFYDQIYQECLELYEHAKTDSKKESHFDSSLLRLRQSCCHPQITGFGSKLGGNRLQSMEDVFNTMLAQVNSEFGSLERTLVQYVIRRALMKELQKQFDDAIRIYREALILIQDRRKPLEIEIIEPAEELLNPDNEDISQPIEVDDMKLEGVDHDVKIEKSQADQLRLWRELEHRVKFNLASVYLELENKLESDKLFLEAEIVRKQLMTIMEDTVSRHIKRLEAFQLETKAFSDSALRLPMPLVSGGISSKTLFSKISKLIEDLNQDVEKFKSVHQKIVTVGLQSTHSNYEEDALLQEEGNRCLDMYMSELLPRRKDRILGVHSTGSSIGVDESTEQQQYQFEWSLKACLHEMKQLLDRSGLLDQEKLILRQVYPDLQDLLESQTAYLKEMDRELIEIRRVYNAKIVFYRLLQRLSDAVAIPQVADPKAEELSIIKEEGRIQLQLQKVEGRKRYLEHLATTAHQEEEHSCGVCRSIITTGLLTPCGHLFCETCLLSWASKHHRCPLCAAPTGTLKDLTPISVGTLPKSNEIVSDPLTLKQETMKLEGSFGTKIAAILRHITYLKELEPDTKCLVFSQWELMLDILANAFQKNSIAYVKLGNSTKYETVFKFNHDPNVRVFMLNSRTQSSGLTLVKATHVFLMEPLLNPAIEMQAIHRIHRIGQTKTTFIHRYIVRNTVEEQLHQLSRERRSHYYRDSYMDQATLSKTTRHSFDQFERSDVHFLLRLD